MVDYEFQGTSHHSAREAHLAVASAWLTAGGLNSYDDFLNAFWEYTDEELARKCDGAFGMSDPEAGSAAKWFDLDELVEAFAYLRADAGALFD